MHNQNELGRWFFLRVGFIFSVTMGLKSHGHSIACMYDTKPNKETDNLETAIAN